MMEGDHQHFKPIVRPQLFEDVLNVIAHGGRADAESVGDVLGVLPGRELIQNLTLPFAERKRG